MRQWWDKSVRISLDGRVAINVNSNEAAAELLLGADWPGKRSKRHLYARETILMSADRPDDPGAAIAARMAFEAVAREAGVLATR